VVAIPSQNGRKRAAGRLMQLCTIVDDGSMIAKWRLQFAVARLMQTI
jgi:hypothetical protein